MSIPRGPLPPPRAAPHPLPSRTAVRISVTMAVPMVLLLWCLSCAKGACPPSSRRPHPRHTCRSQHKGGWLPRSCWCQTGGWLVYRCGGRSVLCAITLRLPPWARHCPSVLVPWVSAWYPGLGPLGQPGTWEMLLTTPARLAPPAYLGCRRGLRAHTGSGCPGGFSQLGQGEGAAEAPVLCVGWSPQPLPVTWLSM